MDQTRPLGASEQAGPSPDSREETLDPQDWSAMRALGHRMVDDMFGWMENLRDRPVWQPVPKEVKEKFRRRCRLSLSRQSRSTTSS